MDFTNKSPVILSLCTGIRGLERGLERAFKCLQWQQPSTFAYVEIEAVAAWNLVRQMEQGVLAPAAVYSDVKTFDAHAFHRKVDGIIGGYPCQPFSTAGKRKGTKDPRHLWPYICSHVSAIKPVFCFFENVDDHITMGYDEVYRSLRELGYKVEAGIYTASEVGAPHERKRLFILAMDNANRTSAKSKIPTGRHAINGASFPMGQGFSQHIWEESRIKSRLDFTVNGYNFREDLLRMAGNAVVEQTAELAFLDLLSKFES